MAQSGPSRNMDLLVIECGLQYLNDLRDRNARDGSVGGYMGEALAFRKTGSCAAVTIRGEFLSLCEFTARGRATDGDESLGELAR
jgi:hypothetical protein